MTGRADRQIVGSWQIVEADLRERDFLDLVGPAMLAIRADGTGEIAFGAVQAGLDVAMPHPWSSSPAPASTRWTRSPATGRPSCSKPAHSK